MLFPKRQDYLGPFSGVALGDIIQKEITREFLIDSIDIVCVVTVGTAMATPNPDGLMAILKRITLQVTDGARNRNVVDVSGPGLMEYNDRMGAVDNASMAVAGGNPAAASVNQLTYHIPFRQLRMNDPEACYTLLPCNRYSSNPLLTLYFATQADIDQDASPDFALTDLTFYIVINRRQVGIDKWPIFDTELIESTQTYPAVQSGALFELPTPGSFAQVLCRGYAGAAPTITRSFNVTANGDYKVQVLGTVLRRIQPTFLLSQNTQTRGNWFSGSVQLLPNGSGGGTDGTGSVMFDFMSEQDGPTLGDYGSILDTNALIKTGARAQILVDVNGGTGVQIKYLWNRIYGNLAGMKAALKLAGG
jgi:hypothetical protein